MASSRLRDATKRRYHVKSHTGCRNCKIRKVKCDEKTPSCGNCIKHNVECEFLTSSRGIPVGLRAQPPALSMVDLELLHNYSTRTYATLSDSLILRDFYRITAVEYGLRHDYIMHALLAVSACHMAYYRAEQRNYYQGLAVSYHQTATKSALELMTKATPAHAESLFLYSTLTIFFALGSPRRNDHFLLVGESGFADWLFLLQGTQTFMPMLDDTTESLLAPLLRHGKDCWFARENNPDVGAEVHRQLDRMKVPLLLRQPNARLRATYAWAIDQLHKSFSIFDAAGSIRCDTTDAFVWLHQVAGDLLPLLRDVAPDAVAVFAFFAAFLKRAGAQWYLCGWAEHLVAKSYNLLDAERRLWIQWPMEEVGWTPDASALSCPDYVSSSSPGYTQMPP